jgi:hypothetical protein
MINTIAIIARPEHPAVPIVIYRLNRGPARSTWAGPWRLARS